MKTTGPRDSSHADPRCASGGRRGADVEVPGHGTRPAPVAPSGIVRPLTVLEFVRDPEGVWTLPAGLIAELARRRPEVRFESPSDRTAAERLLPEADVVYGVLVDAENFPLARRLRWIHVSAAGRRARCSSRRLAGSEVVLTNGRGLHAVSMAEHALGLMLGLRAQAPPRARPAARAHAGIRPGLWTRAAGASRQLVRRLDAGASWALGRSGRALAERARGAGDARASPCVRHPAPTSPRPAHEQWGLARLPDDLLASAADWVVLGRPAHRRDHAGVDRA